MSNVNITVKIDRQGHKADETYAWANQSYATLSAMQHALAGLMLGLANWGATVSAGHAPKMKGPKDTSLELSMVITHAEDNSKHSRVIAGYDNIAADAVEQIVSSTHQALAAFLPSATKS